MGRKLAPLPIFMRVVAVVMYVLYSGYWAIDVYLLWADVYLYLPHPLAQTDLRSEYLDGLYVPWSVAYFVPQVFRFIMVKFSLAVQDEPFSSNIVARAW